MLSGLKRLIRASGRKHYVFVMGKLNAAKLANFAEVGVYVLLGSAEPGEVRVTEVLPLFHSSLALAPMLERHPHGVLHHELPREMRPQDLAAGEHLDERLARRARPLSTIDMGDTSVSARFREPDPSKPRIVLAYSGGLDTSTQLAFVAAPALDA